MKASGVKQGDILPLCVENYGPFFLAIFAAWAIGAVPVPINMSLPHHLRDKILELTQADQCITPLDDTSWGVQVSPLSYSRDSLDGSIGMILFTSGSTGIPKGVVCTHDMIGANARAMADQLRLTPDDRLFINTPPYYTSAICHLLTAFTRGASLVARSGFFFGDDLLQQLSDSQCTGFGGAPAHIIRIIDAVEENKTKPSLRFIMSSGDHLPVDVITRVRSAMPDTRLHVVYGLSEVAGRLCVLPPDALETKMGSVGKPLADMQISILEDNGELASTNQSGEIVVSGSLLMPSYFEAEEVTRNLMGKHGFHTGDIGRLDSEGYLYVEGRKDDVFKSGGEKVSTKLIEKALREMNQFEDVAAMATTDDILGQVPVAFVVMKQDIEFKRVKILRQLKSMVPHTHIPRQLMAMPSIPRTGSGKIIKQDLRNAIK